MKKYFIIILLIIVLAGCQREQNTGLGEPEVPNVTGNSYGNLINDGFIAKQDNLLVYMKYEDSNIPFISRNDIVAKKEDGTNEVILTSRGFGDLNVKGEWVYYTITNFTDVPMLYRVKLDGTGKEKLVKGAVYVQINTDKVYYYDKIKNGLYKMDLDGTNKVQIYSPKAEVTMNFLIDKDQIYFYKPLNDGSEGKLYSMSLNGSNIRKVNDTVSYFQKIRGVDEENLYFEDENEHLYQVNKQSGKETKVTNQKVLTIIVDGSWIYYLNSGDNYHLYKMKKNGEDNRLLVKQEISDINILDNWIYYKINGNEDIFRVKTDGTENRLFSNHK